MVAAVRVNQIVTHRRAVGLPVFTRVCRAAYLHCAVGCIHPLAVSPERAARHIQEERMIYKKRISSLTELIGVHILLAANGSELSVRQNIAAPELRIRACTVGAIHNR